MSFTRVLTCLLLFMGGTAANVFAQSFAGASAAAARAGFGGSIAVTDGEVLVGEPANSLRPGTVYVYRRAADGWVEAAQIRADEAAAEDGFGSALAVSDQTMVVGARAHTGGRGAAFVFERGESGWDQTTLLAPVDLADGDAFGAAVALSGDMALIAAPGQADQAGAVYVFRRTGSTWTQAGKLVPSAAAQRGSFGAAVVLAGDMAFIGMPGANENRGSVLVYNRSGGGEWQEGQQIGGNQLQPNDRLGAALALHDGTLAASAPFAANQAGAIYTFRHSDDGEWQPSGRLVGFDAAPNSRFGTAVAFENGQLWAGAPAARGNRGALYRIWQGADDAFEASARVVPAAAPEQGARFGTSVAVRGTVAAVGLSGDDHGAGTVVVFEQVGDDWVQRSVLKSPPEAMTSITGAEVKCSDVGSAAGFDCRDVELLSFLSLPDMGAGRGVNANDIWGWTDPETGTEYALLGRVDGTSFVDVSDPLNPVWVANLPKTAESPASSWRDIKVYRDHAYIVSDGAGPHGMQILDLTRLREFEGTPLQLTPDTHYRRINSAHNIVINEESGFAYAVGASSGGETCGGGLHMMDIRDPKNPEFVGCFSDPQTGRASTGYSHDAQCVTYRGPDERYTGREICLGSNETALSIADVTDKQNPRALSRASYPDVAYSHQGWLTEDHRYFYMNDELDEVGGVVDRTRTLVWDLADLEDPTLIEQHEGVEGATDHNLYIRGNLMYQSNYKSGLRILDVSDPANPREVAFFDTLPVGDNEEGFAGTWSNYPYFESGIIIVSGIGEGLFVLKKRDTTPVF